MAGAMEEEVRGELYNDEELDGTQAYQAYQAISKPKDVENEPKPSEGNHNDEENRL